MAEDPVDGPRRRCKARNSAVGSSPRGVRRSRRRVEGEIREEREVEEVGRARKRRNSGKHKKEKGNLGNSVTSIPSPKADEENHHHCNLDQIGQMMSDLVMWNDVAKSSLWFGFGCLSFLSSCFAKGVNFSIFSFMSQIGLLTLGLSFISNTICQRNDVENRREFKLTEEDLLKAGRVILPTVNYAFSKTRELFSGEPTMTLRVAPFLLVGAEYGHLITLRRLCALGFFMSFSVPKLYSCYRVQINGRVEGLKRWAIETWGACSHKKIVAASAVTAFWNLTSLRTRVFSAFLMMVILRYHRQHLEVAVQEEEVKEQHLLTAVIEEEEMGEEKLEQLKALVVVDAVSEK